jgi:hypothetical protein
VCRRQCGRIPAAGLEDVPHDLALGVVPGELLRELFRPGPELWLAQHPASRCSDCLGGRVVGCQIDAGAGPLEPRRDLDFVVCLTGGMTFTDEF